jgi:hypothetical protein
LYDAFVVEGAEGAIEEFAVARDVAYDLLIGKPVRDIAPSAARDQQLLSEGFILFYEQDAAAVFGSGIGGHEPAYTAADYYRMVHGMFSFLFKTDMLSIIMDIILKVRGL